MNYFFFFFTEKFSNRNGENMHSIRFSMFQMRESRENQVTFHKKKGKKILLCIKKIKHCAFLSIQHVFSTYSRFVLLISSWSVLTGFMRFTQHLVFFTGWFRYWVSLYDAFHCLKCVFLYILDSGLFYLSLCPDLCPTTLPTEPIVTLLFRVYIWSGAPCPHVV